MLPTISCGSFFMKGFAYVILITNKTIDKKIIA